MNSCAKPLMQGNQPPGGCSPGRKSFRNLGEIVQHYIANRRREANEELEHFANQPNLRAAIRTAALAVDGRGKRHKHQRRIPGESLEHFRRALSRNCEALRSCQTFPELLQISEKAAEGFWKNSKLTVYDTTLRISAHLSIWPDRVYLHAGAREGAMALGFKGNLRSLTRSQLPKEFQKLKPYEIEHCLCSYKDHLKRLRLGERFPETSR